MKPLAPAHTYFPLRHNMPIPLFTSLTLSALPSNRLMSKCAHSKTPTNFSSPWSRLRRTPNPKRVRSIQIEFKASARYGTTNHFPTKHVPCIEETEHLLCHERPLQGATPTSESQGSRLPIINSAMSRMQQCIRQRMACFSMIYSRRPQTAMPIYCGEQWFHHRLLSPPPHSTPRPSWLQILFCALPGMSFHLPVTHVTTKTDPYKIDQP